MNRGGRTALIIILILALITGLGGAGYGIYSYRQGQVYTQKIQAGDRYLAAGDYDNAVLMYQDAIRLNDRDERGYLKLASAYVGLGDYTLAISTLEDGYAKTKSKRIQEMLQLYQESGGTQGGVQKPTLNTALLNKLNESSYSDYVNRNEVESVTMNGTAEAIVRLKGIPVSLTFFNTQLRPNVVVGGRIAEDAFPEEIHFDDLVGLLSVSGVVTLEDLKALEFNSVEMITSGQDNMLRLTYMGSTILAPCNSDGSVDTSMYCDMSPALTDAEDGTRQPGAGEIAMIGKVEDAQSGVGIADATIAFYEGVSAAGDPVLTVTTDDEGRYSTALESGQYHAVITKEGYSNAEKDVYIGSYSSEHEENFVLSMESEGEIRIVLEWNGGTCDLDSYLRGGGQLMNAWNREISSGGQTAAVLDRDSRSAPGVETTTIYDMSGSYEFFVFDYMATGTMQSSGATVTIYAPGRSPESVSIPSDAGNTWYVCRIEAGSVRITNYMAEESASYAPK